MRKMMVAWLCVCWSLFLGGCGEDAESEKTTLEIFSWWFKGGEAQALQVVIDAHKATHPEVVITNTAKLTNDAGNDSKAELRKRMQDKNPPDIFQQTGTKKEWLTHGEGVQVLDTLFAQKGWGNHLYSFLQEDMKVSGKKYYIPTNVHSQNYLFYNKGVFGKAGLTGPPKTIKDLFTTCDTLKAKGYTCLGMSTQGWIMRIYMHAVMVATATGRGLRGGQFLKDVYAGKGDDATLSEAITNFDKIMTSYINSDAATSATVGWDTLTQRLADGKIAIFLHGDWVKGALDSVGKTPGTDYDVVMFPDGTSGETFLYNVDTFALPVGSKHYDDGISFIDTFLSSSVQVSFSKLKGSCPVRKGADISSFDSVAKTICNALTSSSIIAISVLEVLDTLLARCYDPDTQKKSGAIKISELKSEIIKAFKAASTS